MAQLIMAEGATPSTPSAGKATIFINTSGKLCVRDDAGNVFVLASLSAAQEFTGELTLNRIVMALGATLTIAAGAITVTGSFHVVDTEGGAATDDLDTINGGVTNQRLILRTSAAARDVTLKHGTGNIFFHDSVDRTMSSNTVRMELMFNGSSWTDIW